MDEYESRVAKVVGHFAWPSGCDCQPGRRLIDLGIDSMAVISLALALEVEFGVVVPDELFTGEVFDTTATLATAMRGLCLSPAAD